MSAKNRALSRIIITVFLIIISPYVRADHKELPAFSKEWPEASQMVYQLYRAMNDGTEIPELMLKQIDDTLSYGQFWPNEKFEIIKRKNKIFIPLTIWTGKDTCAELRQYIEHDPTIRMFLNTHAKYMVPLNDLPKLIKFDCIKNIEEPINKIPPINIYTMQGRGNRNLKLCSLSEDQIAGTIRLLLSTKGMFSTGGYKIIGDVDINNSDHTVKIRTKIEGPRGIATDAFAPASGSINFLPPSDSFDLDLDGDIYSIILKEDSIYIKPYNVCDNVITHKTAPRHPSK